MSQTCHKAHLCHPERREASTGKWGVQALLASTAQLLQHKSCAFLTLGSSTAAASILALNTVQAKLACLFQLPVPAWSNWLYCESVTTLWLLIQFRIKAAKSDQFWITERKKNEGSFISMSIQLPGVHINTWNNTFLINYALVFINLSCKKC